MAYGAIYSKTEEGRNEIKTRAHKLPTGLRSLLLMVDGQRSEQQLHEIVTGLHAPPDALKQLLAAGLIQSTQGLVAANSSGPVGVPRTAAPSAAPVPLSDTAHRFGILYNLMTDAVREHLGLRGYFLQLKIERGGNVAELAMVLDEVHKGLVKAKGMDFADEWVRRIRALARV